MRTKSLQYFFQVLILVILMVIAPACDKLNPFNTDMKPEVTTSSITNITGTTALGGGVTKGNSYNVYERGIEWSTDPNVSHNSSYGSATSTYPDDGSFSVALTNLTPGTKYYVFCYVKTTRNGIQETFYGEIVSFTTLSSNTLPQVDTYSITEITETTAKGSGNVISEGSTAVTARGLCWSTSESPTLADSHTTDGSGPGLFNSSLTGLYANTPYFVRAYATNSNGTAYGNQTSFTTAGSSSGQPCPGMAVITDSRDGKQYPTIQIGSQCWLQKNMNYNTGTSWCYENSDANCETYGRLYNWQTALTVCPAGWHLPGNSEWITLFNFLGNSDVAGGKMKEAGLTHWYAPNYNATNSSGFTALPGGNRSDIYKSFNFIYYDAYFWSSLEADASTAYMTALDTFLENADYDNLDKLDGLSVRCIRD